MDVVEWERPLTTGPLAGKSRIAKVEAADPSVSLDLLIRSRLAMGASRGDLARMISAESSVGLAKTGGRR